MNIRRSFNVKDLKSYSKVFDKSLLKTVQNLKSPDKRIKNAMIYFIKTGRKKDKTFFNTPNWVNFWALTQKL